MLKRVLTLCLFFTIMLPATGGAAPGQPWLIVVGDSWAARLATPTASAGGFEVKNVTHKSARADGTARDEYGLLTKAFSTVQAAPAGSVVLLMLGEADIGLDRLYRTGRSVPDAVAGVTAGVGSVVDQLRGARSDIPVYLGGYDLLPAEGRIVCYLELFFLVGTMSATSINADMAAVDNALAQVAASRDGVYHLSTLGTLQGRAGNPNMARFSPGVYQDMFDCHHPNARGASILANAIVGQI
jgi:lysophospholipase L1-like esterase